MPTFNLFMIAAWLFVGLLNLIDYDGQRLGLEVALLCGLLALANYIQGRQDQVIGVYRQMAKEYWSKK